MPKTLFSLFTKDCTDSTPYLMNNCMIQSFPVKKGILSLIPKVQTFLSLRKDTQFAYLFGSHARGRVTPFSDVDIAVYLTKGDFSEKKLEILGFLINILKTEEIDLVVLNTAPLTLRMKILQNRRLLADNSPFVRHAYESLTIREYLDFSKIENRILERRFLNG